MKDSRRALLLSTLTLLLVVNISFESCKQPVQSASSAPTLQPTPAQSLTPAPSPQITPVPVPSSPTPSAFAPTKFKLISIDVTPIVAAPGQVIVVTTNVSNTGGTKGSYTLTLNVNGVKQEAKDVTVGPGATGATTFSVVKNISGIYTFGVEGLTQEVRVKDPGTYPRLAKFYCGPNAFFWKLQQLDSSQINSQLNTLSSYDLIIVDYSVASFATKYLQLIRKQNPHIKILAYIEAGTGNRWRWLLTNDLQTQTNPNGGSNNDFMHYLSTYYGLTSNSSNEQFFLHHGNTPGNIKPPDQNRVTLWTNSSTGLEWPGMNPNSEWPTYLANFVHDKVMSSGLFDGVFYDNMWEKVYSSNVDIDNDGITDSPSVVDQKWQQGMTKLLQITRNLLGPDAIIFGNPGNEWSANSTYFDYANGHMEENALGTLPLSNHDFSKIWDVYERNMQKPAPPTRIHIIAADTNNKQYDPLKPDLPPSDLQKMRYGLGITLLDDGYFNFDIGSNFHSELWWFPEYDANLGLAKGTAQKRSDGTLSREFQNGIVIVNPTSSASIVDFTSVYQDITTGNKGTHFTIQPQDGRIFILAH